MDWPATVIEACAIAHSPGAQPRPRCADVDSRRRAPRCPSLRCARPGDQPPLASERSPTPNRDCIRKRHALSLHAIRWPRLCSQPPPRPAPRNIRAWAARLTGARVVHRSGLLWELTLPGLRVALASLLTARGSPSLTFRIHAANSPHKTAILWRDRALTYAELNQRIDRAAIGFQRRGVRRGASVLVMMRNRPSSSRCRRPPAASARPESTCHGDRPLPSLRIWQRIAGPRPSSSRRTCGRRSNRRPRTFLGSNRNG